MYNLDDNVVVLNDSLLSAKVVLEAKGFILFNYLFSPSETITIDAQSDVSKKGNRLFWDIENRKYELKQVFGKSVNILSVKPDTLFIDFDVLASKNIPVEIEKNISFTEGFDLIKDLKLSQDSVKIIGSKTLIDKISSIKTKSLILKDVNSNINQTIAISNDNKNLKIVPETLEVTAVVKRFTEGKVLLPIKKINVPENTNIKIFPKQVELIYYVDIESYKSIKPEDFEVVADFSKISDSDQNSLNLEIKKVSDKVKNARLFQNSIEFIISK
ncbi:CdaR family protein [Winogradskyella litorisediminis]|uniref:CdaR family protein n=1 Tax=Winogradskyella litorisediminis TaxID=1156618 RepID=A0ABW3N7G9_9FLAO